MTEFFHILAIWMHILGITLFVGPQFFLAFAWLPASRGITDMPTRLKAMRTITDRFKYVGGLGLLLILIAGIYLIATWRDYYAVPDDTGFNDVRFGVVFSAKMLVLAVMLIATGLHTFRVGPRLIQLMEDQSLGQPVTDEQIRAVRVQSMALSIGGLVLTLVIMVMGAMMNATKWSLQ